MKALPGRRPGASRAYPAATSLPIRRTLMLATALSLPIFHAPAQAQAVFAPVAAEDVALEDSSPRRFEIPAGPLDEALGRFGRQAGVTIAVNSALTTGLASPGVSGDLVPIEALALLLAGTGLQAERDSAGEYTLRRLPASEETGGTTGLVRGDATTVTLPAVRVTASRQLPAGLPPAFAGGQVATGGRVGLLGNRDFMETPFNTTSYTDDYVRNRQAADVGEVIAATDPSIHLPQKRNYIDSFYIRGFNMNAIDTTFNGLAGIAPFLRASSEIAERVEVLKGPSAMLNGMLPQGGVGGSINIVPKRAAEQPLTRLTTSYESDGLPGAHVDVGRRLGDAGQWGIRVNALYRDGDTAVRDQQQRTGLAALALDWRGAAARASLDLYRQNTRMDGMTYYGIASIGPQVTALPAPRKGNALIVPPWSFGTEETTAGVLRGEWDLGAVTVFAAAGWQTMNYSMLVNNATLLNARGDIAGAIVRLDTDYSFRSGELGVRGGFELGRSTHDWSFAVTGFRRNGDFASARFDSPLTNIYAPDFGEPPSLDGFFDLPRTEQRSRLRSVALADTVSFFDRRLQLTAGLRHQKVINASYDETATSPSAAVLLKANERVSLYGNYIEGLSQGGTAPATAANAGAMLEPFKSRQLELGIKYDPGGFAMTASVFRIRRPSAYTDRATNIYAEYGQQRNTGLELAIFGEPLRGIRVIGGLAYVQARLLDQADPAFEAKQATGVPRFIAKLGAEYDLDALPGLSLTGAAAYTGKQYAAHDNRLVLDAYSIVDLGLRYQTRWAGRSVTLRANVHNVFDKAYWIGSWGGGSGSGLSGGFGAPRTLLLSAQLDL